MNEIKVIKFLNWRLKFTTDFKRTVYNKEFQGNKKNKNLMILKYKGLYINLKIKIK